MIWYSCSRNRADPIFIFILSFFKRTEHLVERSASLIKGHPFCYQTIHSMWATVPWCVLLVPLAATGLRCPETASQTAGIVLDPSPLISQSKKGFPVSELRARQDAEGVCATFPFSRNPNLLLPRWRGEIRFTEANVFRVDTHWPLSRDWGIWTMSLWKDFVLKELTVMSTNSQIKDEEWTESILFSM